MTLFSDKSFCSKIFSLFSFGCEFLWSGARASGLWLQLQMLEVVQLLPELATRAIHSEA